MKTILKALLILLGVTAFFGCTTEEQSPIIQKKIIENPDIDPKFYGFLKIMGYDDPGILQIEVRKEDFIIDNEIIIHKKDYNDYLSKSGTENSLWRKNYYTSTTPYQKRVIPFRFRDQIPSYYKTKLISAFNEWNKIRNFNITFSQVEKTYAGKAVSIYEADPNSTTIVQANLPWESGSFGDLINLSPTKLDKYSDSQITWILVHAIGHLIGIGHETDKKFSNFSLVAGTFSDEIYTMYDKNMNTYEKEEGIPNWSGFNYTDLLAIRYIWPYDNTEKAFYAYLKTSTGGYNWTTDWNTYQYAASGFSYWGVNGYIYTTQKSGTVPLYKYRHNVTHVDYLSLNPNLSASYPGYIRQSTIGYVFTSNAAGSRPIYEWYHPNKGFYFTTLANDGVVSSGGWTGGGIAFYTLTLDAN